MDNNKKNEELQSRREFFKSAAKAALPVIGAVVLAQVPILAHSQAPSTCSKGSCAGTCWANCRNACEVYCTQGCTGHCKSACKLNCTSKTYHH